MDRDLDRARSITRRAAVLGALQLGAFGALVGRLYWLQVVEAEKYRVLAEGNRVNVRLIAPTRGQILDRFGAPIATNEQNFQLLVTPEQAGDVERTLGLLGAIVPVPEVEVRRVAHEVQRKRKFLPLLIRENLTWAEVAKIEANAPDLAGVTIEVGQVRSYPFAQSTAHLTGYVGAVAEAELNGDPVLALPGFRIGKVGIERGQDDDLRGTEGEAAMEVNAFGRTVRELSRDEGDSGRDVTLSIDIGLQNFAQERLAQEQSAAAIVMDVHSGAVYTLASHPSYDPNVFSKGIPQALWEELLADERGPLTNKAIAGQYPPGSTFKMITAMAGLESGAITLDHHVHCSGATEIGGYRFACWRKQGHGTIGLTEAIAQSCDCFFYDVGRRAGIDQISAMAHRLGVGMPTGLDMPGEKAGLVPTQAWKKKTFGIGWQQGETLVCAIGQGFVKATPLQLATMVARLASGGLEVKPRLVEALDDETVVTPIPASLGFKPAHVAAVLEGMRAVTAHGTGHSAQIPEAGMEMAGKSGTAQVRNASAAEREGSVKNEDLPWRYRHHAWFVGFAPIEAPRYACAAIIEHGGHGGAVAGPLVRDLLWEAQKRNPARPVVVSSG